ncbi:hypothetical protein Pcinc_032914 [Petrolisthes cinctipes]|uniref:Uncharacterized protein n=1 Tax=Petrolisthes cinctipes TaxID=88211 RepID=A0AAE1ETD2_PETCI|nr:hypothetical protein Pcinc_032914 [Petrolisthes cinctipes]
MLRLEPLGASDHIGISADFLFTPSSPPMNKTTPNYNRGDYESLRNALDIEWKRELAGLTAQEMTNIIEKNITDAVDKHIPTRKHQTTSGDYTRKPLWMTRTAYQKTKRKRNLWIRYLNTKDNSDYQQYIKARNEATHANRRARRDFESKIAQESRHNTKTFWNYVNSRRVVKGSIPDLQDPQGQLYPPFDPVPDVCACAECIKCETCDKYLHPNCSKLPAYALVNWFTTRHKYKCELCVRTSMNEEDYDRKFAFVSNLLLIDAGEAMENESKNNSDQDTSKAFANTKGPEFQFTTPTSPSPPTQHGPPSTAPPTPVLNNILTANIEDHANQDQQLRNITINTTDIIDAIKTLSNNSAAGPDHIPAIFLKRCADSNITNSTVTSFADDTRITKVINTNEDAVLLQNDLEEIYEWANINNMKFNNNKFDHLRYSTTPTQLPNASYEAPDGSIIATQPYVRDLALFNSLPRHLRALTNVTLDQFKARLDQFLQDLPDEPHLPHYYSRAPTNSIIDWLALRRADGDFTHPGEATHRDPGAQHHV